MGTDRKTVKIGDQFGKWTVVGDAFKRVDKCADHFYCQCRCECGNEKSVVRYDLVSGGSNSCGCVRNKWSSDRSQPVYQIAAKEHYKSYTRNASKRFPAFAIEEADFHILTSGPCHYCSAAPTERLVRRKKGRETIYKIGSGYFANGIDRIDSSIGYEPGNVVPCCMPCNSAKSNSSYSDFMALCNRVALVHPAKREVSHV